VTKPKSKSSTPRPSSWANLFDKYAKTTTFAKARSLTVAPDLAGVPALSQPCGFTKAGLPIGLQTIGPALGEEICFRVAGAYESRTDWHNRLPAEVTA